jgi:NifU-like protein
MTKNPKKIKKEETSDINKGGEEWLYSDIVKDHFFNPRNVLLDDKDYQYDGKGLAGSAVCGDMMIVWLKIDPKTKRIADCKWRTYGCASAIAATSMMSVMLTENKGMTLKQAQNLKAQQIIKRLGGLPNIKFHCSILGLDALKEAINDCLKKQEEK